LPQSPTNEINDFAALKSDIVRWGTELGFQQVGVTDVDLAGAEAHLNHWLQEECHGARH
jgi:epoxyqueuosine reductase